LTELARDQKLLIEKIDGQRQSRHDSAD